MGKGHIIIDFIQSFSKLFQKTGKDKWKMCENWCKLKKKEREREKEKEREEGRERERERERTLWCVDIAITKWKR